MLRLQVLVFMLLPAPCCLARQMRQQSRRVISVDPPPQWLKAFTATLVTLSVGMAISESMKGAPPSRPSSTTYTSSSVDAYVDKEIIFNNQRTVHLRQGFGALRGRAPAVGGGDRTGTYTWPGGVELGNALFSKQLIDVNGKDVLELGTGTGVGGLAACLSGATNVDFTDGAIEVLEITRFNIERNLPLHFGICSVTETQSMCAAAPSKGDHNTAPIGAKVRIGRLRWGMERDVALWKKEKGYEVVIASEVAYENRSVKSLLQTIKALIRPVSGKAILRLAPEITNMDGDGLVGVLRTAREVGLRLLSYPLIEEDASQLLVLAA